MAQSKRNLSETKAKGRAALLHSAAILTSAFVCATSAWGQWSTGSGGAIYYNGGNVGMGTTSPDVPLDVNGILNVFDTATKTRPAGLATSLGSQFIEYGINHASLGAQTNSIQGGVLRVETRGEPLFTFYTRAAGSTAASPSMNITSTGNLGIGTTNPQAKLEVDGNLLLGGPLVGQGYLYSDQNQHLDILSGNVGGAALRFLSGTLAAQTENMRIDGATGNVGIGTANPQSKLSVNGTIQAKEVIVNTGWSDYVFQPDYPLRPLTEVAAYIQQNHHLPDIPSASEVEAKGISLGDMQAKLLAKIEELTLQMIQSEERNRRLEERLARLEGSRIQDTESRRSEEPVWSNQ